MQLTNDLGYALVFELARQLSPEEQEKLAISLQEAKSDLPSAALSKEEIEKKRQKLLRLAMECPVATEEEIELQDEFRRMFRCRPS